MKLYSALKDIKRPSDINYFIDIWRKRIIKMDNILRNDKSSCRRRKAFFIKDELEMRTRNFEEYAMEKYLKIYCV